LIEMCLCLLLQHWAYLRPEEVTGLRVMQLVRPVTNAKPPYNTWSVNIAPFELGRPAKTGLMDESVTLDGVEWAWPFLEKLVRGRAPHDPLWRFTLLELSCKFREALAHCGLQHLRATLYANRHGGASEDFLRGRRSLHEIQHRGRWRAAASVRRYTKAAKLMTELNKVDPVVISYGEHVLKNLAKFFQQPSLLPSFEMWRLREKRQAVARTPS